MTKQKRGRGAPRKSSGTFLPLLISLGDTKRHQRRTTAFRLTEQALGHPPTEQEVLDFMRKRVYADLDAAERTMREEQEGS